MMDQSYQELMIEAEKQYQRSWRACANRLARRLLQNGCVLLVLMIFMWRNSIRRVFQGILTLALLPLDILLSTMYLVGTLLDDSATSSDKLDLASLRQTFWSQKQITAGKGLRTLLIPAEPEPLEIPVTPTKPSPRGKHVTTSRPSAPPKDACPDLPPVTPRSKRHALRHKLRFRVSPSKQSRMRRSTSVPGSLNSTVKRKQTRKSAGSIPSSPTRPVSNQPTVFSAPVGLSHSRAIPVLRGPFLRRIKPRANLQ